MADVIVKLIVLWSEQAAFLVVEVVLWILTVEQGFADGVFAGVQEIGKENLDVPAEELADSWHYLQTGEYLTRSVTDTIEEFELGLDLDHLLIHLPCVILQNLGPCLPGLQQHNQLVIIN